VHIGGSARDNVAVTDKASLRASDADRERVAGELAEHMAAGRLELEEFDERLTRVYTTRARNDLAALTWGIGLVAFLIRVEKQMNVVLLDGPEGGTRLVAYGEAPGWVRERFERLR
jgi:uncharacterized protein DUF1707